MSFALDRIPGFCDLPDVAALLQRWTNASYLIISQNCHQETQRTPSANSCFRPWRLPLCPPGYPLSETISPRGRADRCSREVLSSGPVGRAIAEPEGFPREARPQTRASESESGSGRRPQPGGRNAPQGCSTRNAPRGCSMRMLREDAPLSLLILPSGTLPGL